MEYYVGIDLGGTNIAVGVVNEKNELVAKCSRKTLPERGNEPIFEDMVGATFDAVKLAGITMDDVKWVGMGIPGSINPVKGLIDYSNNIKFEHVPIVEIMEKRLNKKVYIGNDANVAAYGEYVAGSGKGSVNFVAVTLGTGVGGGIVIDGKIYTGSNFAGAELGHMVIVANGEPCSCGRKGCWEAYASATACIRQTKRAMHEHPDSLLWEVCGHNEASVSARTAFDAMRKGDKVAKEVVDKYIEYIAIGIVDIINIFQPEKICIGGGVCNEGDTLLNPINDYIESCKFARNSEGQTQIIRATLGNDAGILGAALLGKLYGSEN